MPDAERFADLKIRAQVAQDTATWAGADLATAVVDLALVVRDLIAIVEQQAEEGS